MTLHFSMCHKKYRCTNNLPSPIHHAFQLLTSATALLGFLLPLYCRRLINELASLASTMVVAFEKFSR